jgi:CheB methylesterase
MTQAVFGSEHRVTVPVTASTCVDRGELPTQASRHRRESGRFDRELIAPSAGPVPARAGNVLIARCGVQMRVCRQAGSPSIEITDDPPENGCRPSVDYLLRCVADVYRDSVLAVILTGMGRDGTEGCRHFKQRGGFVLTQDEESSIVFGMPYSVQNAGLSDAAIPLDTSRA